MEKSSLEGMYLRPDFDVHIIESEEDVSSHTEEFSPWGYDNFTITAEHIQALSEGKIVAVNVMDEYTLYIRGEK